MPDIDLSGKRDLVYGHDFQERDTVHMGGRVVGHIARREPDGISADGETATVTINLSKRWRP